MYNRETSVPDPEDPYVFETLGSGSGSFHQQAIKMRKTMISNVFLLLNDMLYERLMLMYLQWEISKQRICFDILKATAKKSRIRIRIRNPENGPKDPYPDQKCHVSVILRETLICVIWRQWIKEQVNLRWIGTISITNSEPVIAFIYITKSILVKMVDIFLNTKRRCKYLHNMRICCTLKCA